MKGKVAGLAVTTPLIVPVAAASVRPAGNAPDVIEKVCEVGFPPMVWMLAAYTEPLTVFGRIVVVICSGGTVMGGGGGLPPPPPPLLMAVCVLTLCETVTGTTLAEGLNVGKTAVFVLTTRMMIFAVSPGARATVGFVIAGFVIPLLVMIMAADGPLNWVEPIVWAPDAL